MSLGVLVLALALGGAPSTGKGTRFEQGQKLYNQGDVEAALKLLDAAAQEEKDPAVLETVHLLRGQCFSARQDFVRAEDAFALALESNPDTSLDPARDRVMLCGSPQMLKDTKALLEARGFKEGNTTTPGDFVVERAFVEQ
jgi:tetratricopeptide (TPR) repeat protein